ncbi:Cell wall protein PIR5 [Candida viswanathii]|uniref:Cell wall protein PIR5 n=1 Tax=Candida viswanathii TaxID=5486 RepID=A0A367Y8V1_9ASCO|nr:Cell wall protein PIR5 [Candida viswanathii]
MRFSTAALPFALFAIVNSGAPAPYKAHGYTPPNDCEIDTFEWKFALAVLELDCDYRKYNGDHYLDLVFEIPDGQLEHGCGPVYPLSNCEDCFDAFNYGGYTPKKTKYKRGGESCGDGDECELEPFCEIDAIDCDLLITLKNGVLKDEKHRTGEIVANHQFQFDKPTQPDALYTKGFSIVHEHGAYLLALEHKTKFWHCKVNEKGLYKIYDAKIGGQCSPIELLVLKSDEKAFVNKYNKGKW